jgi:hypothetical protein
MSDIPEAVGAAVEGAAVARAVEPGHGEKAGGKGHFHEKNCLNCGEPIDGLYCKHCGQHAHLHRTMGAFFHDLMHAVLHLDGKLWHTLPLLAFRPGRLTRRYIDGERAKFVSPMALFLFSVFLIFGTFIALGISPPEEIESPISVNTSANAVVSGLEQHTADLKEQLRGLPKDDPGRAAIQREIDNLDKDIKNARELNATLSGRLNLTGDEPHTGNARLDEGIAKWRKNPGLMLYKLEANSYKFSWLLVVISTPMVWLIFAWRRRFGLYDHAVFVTYSIAFMSLFFLAIGLAGLAGVGSSILVPLALIAPLLHLFAHVKGTYQLGYLSAAWRTAALIAFIAVALVVFAFALVMLGTLG